MRPQQELAKELQRLQSTPEALLKKKENEKPVVPYEIGQLQDSADAIWRAVTNLWYQEQAAGGEDFVERLKGTVRANVDFIRGLVEEPRLQAVRVGLVLADLDPIRNLAATGENWLAAPHYLVCLTFVREGGNLTEVKFEGSVDTSTATLQTPAEGKVTVLFGGNPLCTFDTVEGKNCRYFVT
jgi:hypothetical protein